MIFKTYNKDGLVLLDTTKPVFSYLGEFKPKRLLEKEFKDKYFLAWPCLNWLLVDDSIG